MTPRWIPRCLRVRARMICMSCSIRVKPFPECPEKITQSMPRFPSPDLLVMAKLMEDIMLTLRLNAKFSTFAADGAGGLSKYSFLCPNGTIFNQNYFICDWWFNFDC